MRELLSRKERKRRLRQRKRSVLPSISKIKVRFHKICLSGPYNFNQLEKKIGKLKINGNYVPKKRMPLYRTLAYRQLSDRSLTIFLNPILCYLPKCLIVTSYPSQTFLVKLNLLLPDLDISSVEYTIDMYSNSIAVRKNFCTLRRYLYFPYERDIKLYTDGKLKHRKYNVTLQTEKIKMYERGPDDQKIKKKGWHHDDVDRLRIEFTAGRDYLKKLDIRNLENFIKDSKFGSIMKSKFKLSIGIEN